MTKVYFFDGEACPDDNLKGISLIGVPSAHVRQLCLQTRMWKNNRHVRTRIFTNARLKYIKKNFFPSF